MSCKALWLVCAMAAATPFSALAQDAAPDISRPEDRPADEAVCREVHLARKAGVCTFVYANGVRVHVRPAEGTGRVWVHAMVFGPELAETDANRGITSAAVWAARPAERGAGALRVGTMPEGITIRWSGGNTELSDGLEKVTDWLTGAHVDGERLAGTKERRPPPARGEQPEFERAAVIAMGEVTGMTGGFGPARIRPGTANLTAEQCGAWLHEKLATCPLDVAIAGDITLADAEKLARKRLGGLAVRNGGEPAGPQTFIELRRSKRPELPAMQVKTVPTEGTGAMVLVALPGPDMADLTGVRRARLASRVLDAAIGPALDAAGVEHRQVAVLSLPGRVLTGAGAIHAHVRISGAQPEAERAGAAIGKLIREMAEGNVPEATLQSAAEAAARSVEQQEAGAEYWPSALVLCGAYGLDIERMGEAAKVYRAMTAADVAEALRPCVGNQRVVIVLPSPKPEPAAAPNDAPELAP